MTQHTITYDDARREALLDVIRRLNSNPYSLTKSECISEIESMLEAAPQPEADRQQRGEAYAWVSEDAVKGQSVQGRVRRVWWENNEGVGMPIYIAPQPARAAKEQ